MRTSTQCHAGVSPFLHHGTHPTPSPLRLFAAMRMHRWPSASTSARIASHQLSCLRCVGASVRVSTQCHAGMPPFPHHEAPPVTLGSYANTPMAKRFAWHRKVPRRVRALRLWFVHRPRLAPQTAILRIQYARCSWKRNSKGPEDTFHQWKHIGTRHLDLLGAPNCQVVVWLHSVNL